MRRVALLLLALIILAPVASRLAAQGGGQDQIYHNDTLGFAFTYLAGWEVREQLPTRTITAASKADFDAINNGKSPSGLIFTVTMSTFQRIGATQTDDFTPILRKIAQSDDAEPETIKIGDAEGLAIETVSV